MIVGVMNNLSKVMDIFSNILSKRTKGQQDKGLDAQVRGRQRWAGKVEAMYPHGYQAGSLTPRPAKPGEEGIRQEPTGMRQRYPRYGRRGEDRNWRDPVDAKTAKWLLDRGREDDLNWRNSRVYPKREYQTPEAMARHEKRAAMQQEAYYNYEYNQRKPSITNARIAAQERVAREKRMQDPDYREIMRIEAHNMGLEPGESIGHIPIHRDPDPTDIGVPKSQARTSQQRISDAVKRMKESGELDQKMQKSLNIFSNILTKSRFEQRATEGNFIPRPDPKKNTTSENEEETSILLTKESPIQGPGTGPTHSKPSKEVVGRGKKAAGTLVSDASTADDSTYVIGMEKADSADNVRKLKEEEEFGREYDAMYFDRTNDPTLIPDDEVLDAGSDRYTYQSGGAMDRDPDITRHPSVLRRDKAKAERRHHQGEMARKKLQNKIDEGRMSWNMEKADDAREAARYQFRGREPSNTEKRKPADIPKKDPDAPKQGQWKSGKWVQELVNFIKARYEGEDFIPEEGQRLVGMAQRTKDWNEFRRGGGTTYAQFIQEYPQHSSDAILGRENVQPTEDSPIERNWVQDKDTGQDIDLETGEVRGGEESSLSLDDLTDDYTMDSLAGLASEESDSGSRPEENFLGDTLDDENAEDDFTDEDIERFEIDYGEGPHYLDKAEDNIYAIATAAAKGDEDKKEKIVLALKRNHQNLLKAFRFAGEKPKRLRYTTFKEAEERDRQEIQDFWDAQYRDWQEAQSKEENPTKPRWGGEGIGQHMEKAAILKAFGVLLKAAERRTKRQKKADQEAGLDRRLEGVGISTTPTGEIDARTSQTYDLLKPADAMSVFHSAEAMSDKANKAFERRMYELRRQKGPYDEWGYMEDRANDPEAVVTEADLISPKESRKRELAYNKAENKFFRQHRPLYTGQAQNKHIKRRLLNIAQANRDARREEVRDNQIPEASKETPGYSSSPYDYLPYPRVRSKLDIIRNREYNQRRDDQNREVDDLPW